MSGTFWSAARNRSVGYTIGYPPGRGPGDALPLVIMLHGSFFAEQEPRPLEFLAAEVRHS